ncbi:toxin-antitoxin system YwqK family antitoxin [candidate division CSSED10-310 bacterium]|uniref:Toxin-antitoxin system YwqK family antitoxin n=1 Tax=candidate division CSSED10-310 bacterium TaxID=2855610 RepID=A0ABV6YWD3_UNCC1
MGVKFRQLLKKIWLRFALTLLQKSTFDSFTLYVNPVLKADEVETFHNLFQSAMAHIKDISPLIYQRVCRDLPRIAYVKMGRNCYIPEAKAFFIDTVGKKTTRMFASEIVHEAAHAFVLERGIPHQGLEERHERFAVNRQFAFLKKSVLADNSLSAAQKHDEIELYQAAMVRSFKTRWWDNTGGQGQRTVGRIFQRADQHLPPGGNSWDRKILAFIERVSIKRLRRKRKDGLEKEYYRNGQLKSEINYRGGLEEGPSYWYRKDGSLEVEFNYRQGKLHEITKWYDEAGNLSEVETYQNGVVHGTRKIYSHGLLSVELPYVDGLITGTVSYFHDNGECSAKISTNDGIFNGPAEYFNLQGACIKKGTFAQGELEGGVEQYYYTGELRSRSFYKAGKIFGEYRMYYQSGPLYYECTFDHDIIAGEATTFLEDGSIWYREIYDGGLSISRERGPKLPAPVDGVNLLFYLSGALLAEERFLKGNLHGKTSIYYQKGILQRESHYNNGKREGNQTTYYENGLVETEMMCHDDQYDGFYRVYAENGALIRTEIYQNGRKVE